MTVMKIPGTKFFSAIVTAVIISVSAASCAKENKNSDIWMTYFLLTNPQGDIAEYYAKVYKIVSTGDGYEAVEVNSATSGNLVDPSKPKLIIVHGWFTSDRNSASFPSSEDLKKRVLDESFWGKFFNTDEFAAILVNYDVYAYDYLTSVHIQRNGSLFRQRLDTAFGASDASSLSIYAHSMGGLVTRTAVYEGDAPPYLKKIITSGTPYHGSPWASPQWLDFMGEGLLSLNTIPELVASFLTNTDGGSDLRWDNFDNKIPGAENAFLTDLNTKTDRDHFFTAYYGNCLNELNGCSGADTDAKNSLNLLCEILGNTDGTVDSTTHFTGADFAPSDCVVPLKSAINAVSDITDYHGLSAAQSKYSAIADIGSFDHFDIKMNTQQPRLRLLSDLGLVPVP